jgi:hypothetical protein
MHAQPHTVWLLVVKIAIVIAIMAVMANNALAAVISVQPVVAGYFDLAFNPIAPIPAGTNPNHPVVLQVDVMMQVQSLSPGEDSFGFANFGFQFGSGEDPQGEIVPEPGDGWNANNPTVDSNGALPGGTVPLFALNADFGFHPTDLQDITVSMASGAFTNAADPRRNVGETGSSLGSPIRLGSAFLRWDGLGLVTVRLTSLEVRAKLTDGSFVSATAANSSTISLGIDDLAGDYNSDGSVDAADYVAWRKTPGDFGGAIDGYATWRSHFGEPHVGALAGSLAPEPTTMALFIAASLFVVRRPYPR